MFRIEVAGNSSSSSSFVGVFRAIDGGKETKTSAVVVVVIVVVVVDVGVGGV